MSFVKDLNAPLLKLSRRDFLRLDDAYRGIHVFGGIGSGKTSGSGKMLAGAYLRAGFGGCITAVKPEEVMLWKKYAYEHGREKSLVVFDETEGFNFLSYELGRQGMDGIGTVTECLIRVVEAAKKASPGASGSSNDAFWQDAMRMALRYSILPIYAAHGSLSIRDIIRFISTAPASAKDLPNPEWQKGSFMHEVMEAASGSPKVPMEQQALDNTIDYWKSRWLAVPEKTRGNVTLTIDATLDRFLHGRLQRVFCGKTTIVPELSFHGALILLAMPTLTWNEDGVIAQQLFKYMWQRAVLGRNSLTEKHRERPLFLWSDEAQETVSSYDGEFLGMCRGARCAVTYLTQSLPAYYAKMGGNNPHDDAHNLAGKFITHVYHASACPDTNDFASRMIGKVLTRRRNASSGSSKNINLGMSEGNSENSGSSSNFGSSSSGSPGGQKSNGFNSGSSYNSGVGNNWGSNRGRGTSESTSEGYSESMENAIEPGDFARSLKSGGKQNGNEVTAVWFQASRRFEASGSNFMLERFKQ